MKLFTLFLSFLFMIAGAGTRAQSTTGPRKESAKPVRLTPVPLGATRAQVQALLDRKQDIYFGPGTYNIGTLQVKGWQKGLIWGAGRLTTNVVGSIRIEGSSNLVIGNFSIHQAGGTKGGTAIELRGAGKSDLTLMNTLVEGNGTTLGLHVGAAGTVLVQGCSFTGHDIGVSLDHGRASLNVFGGNMQTNRIHIQQLKGHLDARAFGVQIAGGGADFEIHSPSQQGYHLLEGIRSEGSNGAGKDEVLLRVPQTGAAVSIALRANTLGSMARYADYGAAGTLLLVENVNYLGSNDKSSVGVTVTSKGRARVLSIGNKYGLSYDAAPGPFVISATTTVQSIGDLWMLPNVEDYTRSFNEPITADRMGAAGKTVPAGLSFLAAEGAKKIELPDLPVYKLASAPRIANLGELMVNVKEFGAIPDDGKDDRQAIQKALDKAEKGAYEPLYFPAGRYELGEPLFLDHLAGGGFWGDGESRSVLVSTSGRGVITSDGAGYATFVDMGFENKRGAETKTTDFDWINNQSPDKKRGNTGAALQANLFYRCRFENGSIGMAVGRNRMGDSFLLADCIFRNHLTARGEGAAYASEGFNALTNPLAHCLFDNVDHAVLNSKGSFNFYGNRLQRIHTAALKFETIVGDGFAVVNNDMDGSAAPFISTGHSSAKAHLLVDRARVQAPEKQTMASSYTLGGSAFFLSSSFPNRTITNGGGIGDNSLILSKTTAAEIKTNGRAHRYMF